MKPFSSPNPDEVHLWLLEHRVENSNFLSEDERNQEKNYRFEKDRQRYAYTQNAKRIILARYLGKEPCELIFGKNKQGKPSLPGLEFNISHTEGLSILAISVETPLGIDIEKISPQKDIIELARRVLTGSEQTALLSCSDDEHLATFYRFWTAKEAYLKAIGTGFEIEPDQVEISLPKFDSVTSPSQPSQKLKAIACGEDFICHLATQSCPQKISLFQFNK